MIFGSFERMVAFRYLRSRRQESFISVIAFFSLAGIMLGVATLIIVMSVMNGFRAELLDKILGFNGDLTVLSSNVGGLPGFDKLSDKIRQIPGVSEVLPMVEDEVLVSSDRRALGAKVRGQRIDDLERQSVLSSHIVAGSLKDLDDDSIMLGSRLAFNLGIQIGDSVTLTSPNGMSTVMGTVPRVKTYRVAALFNVGMYEYDSGFIYMNLAAAQLFFRFPNAVSQLQIEVADVDRMWKVEGPIAQTLGPGIRLIDWQQSSAAFFNAVQTERNVMFLILSLIIVVAAFNVISSMIMLVKDKGRDIAILRTMGATRGMILRIFLLAGASVGILGTLCGFGLGLWFCENIENIRQFIQRFTGTDLFSAELYFLSQIPAKVDPNEVTTIVIMAFSLSILATIYPAWRAARLDPVEALRYE